MNNGPGDTGPFCMEGKQMTQKEYWERIENEFSVSFMISTQRAVLDAYGYNNRRAADLIRDFKKNVQLHGLTLSNCYHANGIGNNNEYTIYCEDIDADGFVIRKNVATFYYCFGIYGGCYVCLTDLATGKKLAVGRAR